MSTSSNDGVYGLGTTAITVGLGATLAVYVSEIAGENSILIKYGAGGTLWLIGTGASGATLALTDLAANFGSHYLVGTSEALSFDGPCRFYLAAVGATTTVYKMIGKTQGT